MVATYPIGGGDDRLTSISNCVQKASTWSSESEKKNFKGIIRGPSIKSLIETSTVQATVQTVCVAYFDMYQYVFQVETLMGLNFELFNAWLSRTV